MKQQERQRLAILISLLKEKLYNHTLIMTQLQVPCSVNTAHAVIIKSTQWIHNYLYHVYKMHGKMCLLLCCKSTQNSGQLCWWTCQVCIVYHKEVSSECKANQFAFTFQETAAYQRKNNEQHAKNSPKAANNLRNYLLSTCTVTCV